MTKTWKFLQNYSIYKTREIEKFSFLFFSFDLKQID